MFLKEVRCTVEQTSFHCWKAVPNQQQFNIRPTVGIRRGMLRLIYSGSSNLTRAYLWRSLISFAEWQMDFQEKTCSYSDQDRQLWHLGLYYNLCMCLMLS